ncbi:hypothetical protein ABK040_001879 [Willaertia magna]
MQILKVNHNIKYPFTSQKNYESPRNFKLISYGDDIITFVTKKNKVINFYSTLSLFDDDDFVIKNIEFDFGNVIYLKNFLDVTIIVNEDFKIYEIDQNIFSNEFTVKELNINLQSTKKMKCIRGNFSNMFIVMKNNIIYEFDRKKNYTQNVKKDRIENIFGCHHVGCNIILTEKKELLMTGNPLMCRGVCLVSENMKIYRKYNNDVYYLDTFTKIKEFDITKKYLCPLIWSNDLFVVMTDFKLSDFEQEEDDGYFQNNLYLKLKHNQICDVAIY